MKKQIEEMAKDLQDCIDYDEWAAREYGETYVDYDSTAFNMVKLGYSKQNGWISVHDGKPNEGQRVYVYGMRGSVQICRYEWRYNPDRRDLKLAFYKDADKKEMRVRYWMPLPEPPEMKGGD